MGGSFVKWGLRAAAVPLAVVAYITVAGLTGFCASCTSIVDGVLGRDDEPIAAGTVRGSIKDLIVYDLEGRPAPLAAYVGKPTVIDVWATWCPPCRKQRSVIHDLDPGFLQSVNVVALSTDKSPTLVKTFLEKNPSNVPDLMYTSEALQAFGGVSSIPTLVFVDAAGQIRDVSVGVHSTSELKRRVLGLKQAN